MRVILAVSDLLFLLASNPNSVYSAATSHIGGFTQQGSVQSSIPGAVNLLTRWIDH